MHQRLLVSIMGMLTYLHIAMQILFILTMLAIISTTTPTTILIILIGIIIQISHEATTKTNLNQLVGNNKYNNPYNNTYNSGWHNHPNFSWSNNQNQLKPQVPQALQVPPGFYAPNYVVAIKGITSWKIFLSPSFRRPRTNSKLKV